MALGLAQKQAIVDRMHQVASDALSLVIADARGIDSNSMNTLRRDAYENKIVLCVVKNSLAKRALTDTNFEHVGERLVGPAIFGFSMEHPGAAAKLFRTFAKEQELLEVKWLSVDKELWDGKQIDKLASLPTHDEAIAILMGLSMAPLRHMAYGLNEILTRLARVTAAIAKGAATT